KPACVPGTLVGVLAALVVVVGTAAVVVARGAAVVGGAAAGGGAAARSVVAVVVVAGAVVAGAGAGWESDVLLPDPLSTVNAPMTPTTKKRADRTPNTTTPF